MKPLHLTLSCTAALLMAGCATSDNHSLQWMGLDPQPLPSQQADQNANEARTALESTADSQTTPQSETTPIGVTRSQIPYLSSNASSLSQAQGSLPEQSDDVINVTLPPQPVPAFVNSVFGEILEQPFALGPGVAERQELISLRSVVDMPASTLLPLIEQVLADYGLGVTYENGLYTIVEMDELRAQVPRFIRGRAFPDVPASLRPVVQFVELQAIDVGDLQQVLQDAFPDRNVLRITNNRRLNTLILNGLPEDVNAAMALVQQMDELRFAGTQVITLSIRNWDATELASAMSDILSVEGYMVGIGISAPRTLTLLPLEYTNQIMVFAASRPLADRATALAAQLDREAYNAEVRKPFVYQAQHTEASALANIISGVLGGGGDAALSNARQRAQTGQANASGEAEGETEGPAQVNFGANLTVDELGNRVIFVGTQSEYDNFLTLARQLDTPTPEVMIEVTIAEVTLTDDTNYSLDLILNTDNQPDFLADLRSNGSFSGTVSTGELRLSASAAANNNQVNVLSTPRIVTRSGTDASVQVGNDVPVLTSQRASNSAIGGSTDVLQSIQYRRTGVLLSVTPRVYSNNRIDLVINQETSNAATNTNAGISSPLISTRSLSSQLSLQDGQTAVLGGLIENRYTRGNSGIPMVKDIPIIGLPFRQETFNATRTMLVVLVTPYILDTRADRQFIVDTLVRSLNEGFGNQSNPNRTILGPREPMQIQPAGLDFPDNAEGVGEAPAS